MNFLISILGALLGILLAIGIVFFIIYWKIRSSIGKSNMKQIVTAISNSQDYEKESYSREKNVSGITRLLEPEILRDFPDFNKELIFSTCEKNLRKIFNALESKNDSEIIQDENFVNLKSTISDRIKDMKSNNIFEKYDNIEFHQNAIKGYHKENGKATITISTSLGYYYTTNRKDKKSFSNTKKETRYTSEFVYIYDETKFDENQLSFSISCPNCGAPIRGLKTSNCEYCSSHIEKINLKVWKMTSYKEDY